MKDSCTSVTWLTEMLSYWSVVVGGFIAIMVFEWLLFPGFGVGILDGSINQSINHKVKYLVGWVDGLESMLHFFRDGLQYGCWMVDGMVLLDNSRVHGVVVG